MDDRITDVEIKLAFLEKLTQDLDEVVRRLGERVDQLHDDLEALREQMATDSEGLSASDVEKPPHY